MTKMVALITPAIAVLLAVTGAVVFYELTECRLNLAHERVVREAREREIALAGVEIARLKADLEEAREAGALRTALAEKETSPHPDKDPGLVAGKRRAIVLASMAAADLRAEECLAKGDVEGVWLLGMEILALGEEGYEKVIALIRTLDGKGPLFPTEDAGFFSGRFLKAVMDHHEDVLRFGLYLASKDPEALSQSLRDVQPQVLRELGTLLLGSYVGEDPEILAGYSGKLHQQVIDDLETGRDAGAVIQALAQVPTAQAADALAGLLEYPEAPPDFLRLVIKAIVWQGNPRSVSALRHLRTRTKDGNIRRAVDAAVRRLE